MTAVIWLAGSATVAFAQSSADRRWAALAAAAAGIGAVLVVRLLTGDPGRRYFRSLLGAMLAASLTADATLRLLSPNDVIRVYFGSNGVEERIDLPLLVVLAAPLVLGALSQRRAELRVLRRPQLMDGVIVAYATVVVVPALLVGLVHHNRMTYIGQDLGLLVFFVFTYLAGRLVSAEAARLAARELVDLLLLLAVVQLVLLNWEPAPFYAYAEAACAAAIAWAILEPARARILSLGVAITILVADVVAVHNGTNSTTAIELAGALAVIGFVAVRLRLPLPRWLAMVGAVAAVAVFVGFTSDGATVRGQYHGSDPSNLGRTFEAHQVSHEVRSSGLSVVFGRGLGATIDERHAPAAFRNSLLSAGRDLAHVQEVHLLPFAFLLKEGFLGLAWFFCFVLALLWTALRGLERAAAERAPAYVVYATLPLLALAQGVAASSRLQANPLTGLALGLLVVSVAAPSGPRASA